MKKPNQELFRLVRFAIRFPGWHSYDSSMTKHIKRASALGMLEISVKTKQFRLMPPDYELPCHHDVIHNHSAIKTGDS